MFSNEYWSKASHKSFSREIPRQYKKEVVFVLTRTRFYAYNCTTVLLRWRARELLPFSLDSETNWWRMHTPEYIFVFLYIPLINCKLINRAPMRLKTSLVPLFAMKLGLNVNITSKLFCGQETHAIYNFHRVLLILP